MIKYLLNQPNIFLLSLLCLGINLCLSFQISNLSSIFRFLGFGHALHLLWLIPPLAGLLVQPIVGMMSDNTESRFGKRMPYILGWGIMAIGFLFFLPRVQTVMVMVIFLWMIDCSLNGCLEGTRAFTCDISSNTAARSKAFAIQFCFGGLGGVIGTALPYLMQKTAPHALATSALPFNIKSSFIVSSCILLFILALSWFYLKEEPSIGSIEKEGSKKPTSIWAFFKTIYLSFSKSTSQYKKIFICHSVSWIAIFIFWVHYTTVLAQNKYGLSLGSDFTSVADIEILQKANTDSAKYLTIYQYVSLIYGLVVYHLSAKFNPRLLHILGLLSGGVGMFTLAFATSGPLISVSMVAVGLMWASLLILPYAIVMEYTPRNKQGVFLGMFNMSVTLPQILCTLLMPTLFRSIFHCHANLLLMFAAFCMLLSAILWWFQGEGEEIGDPFYSLK